jgi:hypothetical protein
MPTTTGTEERAQERRTTDDRTDRRSPRHAHGWTLDYLPHGASSFDTPWLPP